MSAVILIDASPPLHGYDGKAGLSGIYIGNCPDRRQRQLRNDNNMLGRAMTRFHFSAKALGGLFLFLAVLSILIAIDKGSGAISHIWPFFLLLFFIGSTLAIYRRIWRARGNPDALRNAEAQSLYGVLPEKLRKWLFP